LRSEGQIPPLDGATDWLNSEPLSAADSGGQVVVVHFWTLTCINRLRQEPYVRAWSQAYRDDGLVVIGVQTPEFSFEREIDRVRRATKERGIDYPVVLDSDYEIWGALDQAGGTIAYRFETRDVHLVLSPGAREPIPFRVLLDGEAPGPSHGADVEQGGKGLLGDGRLYQLAREHDGARERTLEITFLEPGAEAYAFTFG
jgi:thiol-disulfide isomerase/thioredoxin